MGTNKSLRQNRVPNTEPLYIEEFSIVYDKRQVTKMTSISKNIDNKGGNYQERK